jgi:hypothetical protein
MGKRIGIPATSIPSTSFIPHLCDVETEVLLAVLSFELVDVFFHEVDPFT